MGSVSTPRPGLRILVVEDEVIVAMMLEDILTELGHHVVGPIHRVNKALEIAQNDPIDIALLDVHVAGAEVYAVAERLEARHIPFVFTTGYGKAGLRDAFSARPVLQKPFSVQSLSDILATALNEKKEC
jgi:CheY-like chemotaxis protein